MKIKTIAIEEHFMTQRLVEEQKKDVKFIKFVKEQGMPEDIAYNQLLDLGEGRLARMDAAGIDMQVIQLSGHCVDSLSKDIEFDVVRESNDILADAISKHPDRFSGFAQLSLQDPKRGATELERCVTKLGFKGAAWSGQSRGRYLDDKCFDPVFEVAERLGVPIYLHPGEPSKELANALYKDLPDTISATISHAGWGWHMENGFHAIRLVVSGVFDRFPKLQVIIGHMGEGIPIQLARANTQLRPAVTHLKRSLEEYFLSNFYISTSGCFSNEALLCTVAVFGIDRVIFAVDYPYATNEEGRKFLDNIPLSPEDVKKISYKNAEKLFKL
jgi:uncharacterized protein